MAERTTRVATQFLVQGAPRPAEVPWSEPGAGPPIGPRAPDLAAPTGMVGLTCVRSPASAGDRIAIDLARLGYVSGEYEVASTSGHFQILVPRDSMIAYSPARLAGARALAGVLEEDAYPFLAELFEQWPDADGDGRLNVLIAAPAGALYPGGEGVYADGCNGDFVILAHDFLDPESARDAAITLVHEATHWYDIGPDLGRQNRVGDWTIEGYAVLAAQLWTEQQDGIGFWDDVSGCGEGCTRILLEEDRYGWPGLNNLAYVNGSTLVRYLVQQATAPGASPLPALGRLRHRNGGLGLLPPFFAAGGSGRTEAELQGELLLAFYADGYVDGIDTRITFASWNIARSGARYPLRRFRLGPGPDAAAVHLARPDGVVGEIALGAETRIRLAPALPGAAIALVMASAVP